MHRGYVFTLDDNPYTTAFTHEISAKIPLRGSRRAALQNARNALRAALRRAGNSSDPRDQALANATYHINSDEVGL